MGKEVVLPFVMPILFKMNILSDNICHPKSQFFDKKLDTNNHQVVYSIAYFSHTNESTSFGNFEFNNYSNPLSVDL